MKRLDIYKEGLKDFLNEHSGHCPHFNSKNEAENGSELLSTITNILACHKNKLLDEKLEKLVETFKSTFLKKITIGLNTNYDSSVKHVLSVAELSNSEKQFIKSLNKDLYAKLNAYRKSIIAEK